MTYFSSSIILSRLVTGRQVKFHWETLDTWQDYSMKRVWMSVCVDTWMIDNSAKKWTRNIQKKITRNMEEINMWAWGNNVFGEMIMM